MNTLHSRIRLVAAVMCLALVVFQTNFNLIVLAQEGDSGESASEVKPEEKPQDGIDGKDGADGADGADGEGASVTPAESGEDGTTGDPGESGESGGPEEDGGPGEDGGDGGSAGDGGDGADGEPGEDGSGAGESESAPSGGEGSAVIETGDATSSGQIENTVNTNTSSLPLCSDATRKEEGKGERDESTGEYCIEEIENQNTANLQNTAELEAGTGDNEANGNNGDASIDTGDAQAMLDLFNLVNTNIIDSQGLLVLLSNLREQLLDIDLRDWAPYLEGQLAGCATGTCVNLGDLDVENQNQATVINDVIVRAVTGANSANGNAGDADIDTGDAYAGVNIVNIVNTNIINSNYLLFIANNFGSFFGDIVFPTASSFFSSLFSTPSQVYDATSIENGNTANISNTVDVGSETGANESSSNGMSLIQTGDSFAAANVFNQANMNLFGGDSFVALVRVSGNWSGNVYGLPPGISWKETGSGILLYSDDLGFGAASQGPPSSDPPAGEAGTTASQGGDEKDGKGKKGENSELNVENQNSATVTNNVQVFALTGENKANENGKGGTISTGDAYAAANIVNVVNTNVIGKNWMLALFNILGDFEGNISFGRPDLWIGTRAEIPHDPLLPGDQITYVLTVANNGDSPANQVRISNIFDNLFLSYGESETAGVVGENTISWNLGTLNPGQSREVSFTADIRLDIPFGTHEIVSTGTIFGRESDENTQDNTDSVQLEVFHEEPPAPPISGGGTSGGGSNGTSNGGGSGDSSSGGSTSTSGGSSGGSSSASSGSVSTTSSSPPAGGSSSTDKAPNLKVFKTFAGEGIVEAGGSVDYTVFVTNKNGGSAYDSILVDVLQDEEGNAVNKEVWELGEILPDEEITLTYTAVFQKNAKPGIYRNNAQVKAANAISNAAKIEVLLKASETSLIPAIALEGSAPLLSGEGAQEVSAGDSEVLGASVSSAEPEDQPFLASVADLMAGYGGWLAILAAAAALSLFFLLKKRLA